VSTTRTLKSMRFEPGLEIVCTRVWEPGCERAEAISFEYCGIRTDSYELIAEGLRHKDIVLGFDFDGKRVWTEKVEVYPT